MTTFIDTGACERKTLGEGLGEVAEVVNRSLCGAKQIRASLRWLGAGERFEAEPLSGGHQLIYVMEEIGTVVLGEKEYEVGPGAGLYLGPGEGAALYGPDGSGGPLKAFHLIGEPQ